MEETTSRRGGKRPGSEMQSRIAGREDGTPKTGTATTKLSAGRGGPGKPRRPGGGRKKADPTRGEMQDVTVALYPDQIALLDAIAETERNDEGKPLTRAEAARRAIDEYIGRNPAR